MARAVSPTLGRQARRARMHDAQKRMGLLSSSSSESQARAGASPAALSFCVRLAQAVTQAASSVVLPLPAGAETSVRGYVSAVSNKRSKRKRSTSVRGRWGGASLTLRSAVCGDLYDGGTTGIGASELESSFAISSNRTNVTFSDGPK